MIPKFETGSSRADHLPPLLGCPLPPSAMLFCSVGNLPGNVSEAELRQALNELMVQTGGTAAPGFPITSCKLYQVRKNSAPMGRQRPGCCCLEGERAAESMLDAGSWLAFVALPEAKLASAPAVAILHARPSPPTRLRRTPTRLHARPPACRTLNVPQGNGDLLFSGVHQVQDKGYAFVEFRSVEEASNAMALDGVKFRDAYLKVGAAWQLNCESTW